MTISKIEKVLALLNQWDPEGRYAFTHNVWVYGYEGEMIAQVLQSNSRIETIESAIVEAFSEAVLDENEASQMAVLIKHIQDR